MRKKVGIILMIAVLACVVIGSQCAGDYLYQQAAEGEKIEIAAGEKIETAAGASKFLVVLDSGHGGGDPGKVGINGALEKDINLNIALKLKKLLEEQGITVMMTREDDGSLADSKVEDLKKRVTIINEEKPALAVSIHQNSYQEESIHGAQVFYYTHSKEGENAALLMQEAMLEADPENTRSAKANDTYYMLKKTEPPVIIVECGFLSNREEADQLVTEEYQQILAGTISQGILKYLSGEKGEK